MFRAAPQRHSRTFEPPSFPMLLSVFLGLDLVVRQAPFPILNLPCRSQSRVLSATCKTRTARVPYPFPLIREKCFSQKHPEGFSLPVIGLDEACDMMLANQWLDDGLITMTGLKWPTSTHLSRIEKGHSLDVWASPNQGSANKEEGECA